MKMIFLHGLGQTASSWNETIQAMDNQGEILCPNLADWLENKEASYETCYRALVGYCSQFDEPLALCGLSLGGVLALQYSLEHPDRVRAMALISTQYKMPKTLLKIQNILFHFMPDKMFSQMGFQKQDFIRLCKSMIELDFENALPNIHCPVLVVCGEKDKPNQAATLQLGKRLPQAEVCLIPGAGHEANVDKPAQLGKELNLFFKRSSDFNDSAMDEIRSEITEGNPDAA